jgi:hypothetical protein
MLECVDADIFKSETGLEKGVALPGYDPPRITSITSTPGLVLEGPTVYEGSLEGLIEATSAIVTPLLKVDDTYEGRWGSVRPVALPVEQSAIAKLWDDEAAERDRFARVVFAAEDTEPDK